MSERVFIFECSSNTYLTCIEKGVFGSNLPWPLEVRKGDWCLLHHYEIGGVFGLWQAATDGGRNLAPRLWGGRFPFQAKIELATDEIIELPRRLLEVIPHDHATVRYKNVLDAETAASILERLHVKPAEERDGHG